MSKYITELGGAISQFFNCLILGGEANYSISSDANRLKRKRLEKFINILFSPFEKNHCLNSYLLDVEKANKLLENYKT